MLAAYDYLRREDPRSRGRLTSLAVAYEEVVHPR